MAARKSKTPQKRRKSKYDLLNLPFVGDVQDKKHPRYGAFSFWAVKPTGNEDRDRETGRDYAQLFLKYCLNNKHPFALGQIVSCMPPKLSGIETGFLQVIDAVMKLGNITYEKKALETKMVKRGLFPDDFRDQSPRQRVKKAA